MNRIYLSLFFAFFAIAALAQTPPSGLEGAALRSWIKSNFYDGNHQQLGYSNARMRMYNYIDNYNNSIICVYGGYVRSWNYGGTGTNPSPINAEHTVPQSFFNKSEPMRSDIHHLFPTYSNWNSRRSNYPFADIPDSQTTWWMINTSESGSIPSSNIDAYSEGTSSNFEPPEAHKGNTARAIFYFYTMYPNYDITRVGDLDLLYQWHQDDPVDATELERNNRIEQYQGNRNPYIDNPEWVAPAWGFGPGGGGGGGTGNALENGVGVSFSLSSGDTASYTIELPANVTSLTVSITGSGDADLYVKRSAINWPGDQGSHNDAEFKAPYQNGSSESVTFSNPAADTWNVLVHGYSSSSGTLTATWQTGSGGGGGTWQTWTWIRETPHNYSNNQTYSYTFVEPGAAQIAVHFDRLDTESGYDFLKVYDENGTEVYSVSGNLINNGSGNAFGATDGWCIVPGGKITVTLTTDYSVTDYGFRIDEAGYLPAQ